MTTKKTITLKLTPLEARALWNMAGEGKGMLSDPAAAEAYIGDKAARAAAVRAFDKLGHAVFGGGT